jgi:hypothetical protein
MASERECEGTHHLAQECQEPVEASINNRFDLLQSLVRTHDRKANRGLSIGGHDSCDHRRGTMKRPPSRYAAG